MALKKTDGYITHDGTFVALDDLEGMERALGGLYRGDPDGVKHGLRKVALELAKQGEDGHARRFLARAREIRGTQPEAPRLLELGVRFEEIGRYDLAEECYACGRSLGCLEPGSWYFLHNNGAYCLAMLGRYADADWLARAAIRIDPHRHNAHKNLGLALRGLGFLEQAAFAFRRASELCPSDGRAAAYLEEIERRLN